MGCIFYMILHFIVAKAYKIDYKLKWPWINHQMNVELALKTCIKSWKVYINTNSTLNIGHLHFEIVSMTFYCAQTMLIHEISSCGFGCLVTLASAMSCCMMSSVRLKTRPIADTYKSSAEWCFSTSTQVNHLVSIPMLMRIMSNIKQLIYVRKYAYNWHWSPISSHVYYVSVQDFINKKWVVGRIEPWRCAPKYPSLNMHSWCPSEISYPSQF